MPPASLSTFAVMNPGPTTAKNSRIRIFQRLRNLMRPFRRHRDGAACSYQRRHRINAGRKNGQTKSAKEPNHLLAAKADSRLKSGEAGQFGVFTGPTLASTRQAAC